MSLTKAQSRTLIKQLMDDPDSKRWSATNLDFLTQVTLDSLWGKILQFAPWATSQLDTIAAAATPGYIDLRNVPPGQLSKRFHRLQSVTREGIVYSPADGKELVIEDNSLLTSHQRRFHVIGNQLWLFPLTTTPETEVRYSYKPQLYTTLGENDAVDWPEGHESAFVFQVAGRALFKGSAEDGLALIRIGLEDFADLQYDLSHQQLGPVVMSAYDDGAVSFGS